MSEFEVGDLAELTDSLDLSGFDDDMEIDDDDAIEEEDDAAPGYFDPPTA